MACNVTKGDGALRWSDTENVEKPARSAQRARATSASRLSKPGALIPNRIAPGAASPVMGAR